MNTLLRKLNLLLSPAQAASETGNAGKDEENSTECDSFLYGDGMGWTGITMSEDGDEDAELPPVSGMGSAAPTG